MDSIDTLATFLGWCIVINVGVIMLALLVSYFFHEGIGKIHSRIFGVSKKEAKATFFRVFQQYRLAIGVLNVVPYIVLKIMG